MEIIYIRTHNKLQLHNHHNETLKHHKKTNETTNKHKMTTHHHCRLTPRTSSFCWTEK